MLALLRKRKIEFDYRNKYLFPEYFTEIDKDNKVIYGKIVAWIHYPDPVAGLFRFESTEIVNIYYNKDNKVVDMSCDMIITGS